MSIDDAALELIQECVQRKSLVYFSANEVQIVFQTQILWVRNQMLTLANSVPPEHIGKVVDSKQFYLKIQSFRLASDKLTTDGVHLQFPLDSLRVIEDNRNAKRFIFDGGERVFVEMLNPIDNETMLRKIVLDMSSSGLSIRTPMQSKLYKPGQRFQNMKIIMDGRVYNEVDAHVVYQQTFLNQKGKSYCQVGFKFETAP